MSKPSCFIIMPLTTPARYVDTYKSDNQHFIHVLDHLFKPAIEAAGMTPIPPITKGSEVIHGDIIKNLETADLVLCDMSILNPNVFFELGIRTALNKSVAMIRDNVTERVPFDTTIINYHEYDCGLEPWCLPNEVNRLTKHLEDCMNNGGGNSLWGYFSMSRQAEVPTDAPEVEQQLGYLIKQVESMNGRLAYSSNSATEIFKFDAELPRIRALLKDIFERRREVYSILSLDLGPDGLDVITTKYLPKRIIEDIHICVHSLGIPNVTFSIDSSVIHD